MKALLVTVLCLQAAAAYCDDVQNFWEAQSPDNASMAVTRRAPDNDRAWDSSFDGTRLVVTKMGEPAKIIFDSTIPGRLPAQIEWSPDSKHIVFTTESSGGHSPWHCTTYVFSVADRKLVAADDQVGLVVTPTFTITAPHTAAFGIGATTNDGVDFEHPKTTNVDLSALFKPSVKP
ncbi:MAG: hypothetical protein ACREKL_00525 [Chthoniobacterales bacterium]